MQTVTVDGYLAADPSLLAAEGSGKTRASFRLLETARFRRADGQVAERTTGFNCVCFSEAIAQNYIAPYACRGARAVVSGHVENDTWTGRDGVTHYDLRLVVEAVRLKTRRDDRTAIGRKAACAADLEDEIPV